MQVPIVIILLVDMIIQVYKSNAQMWIEENLIFWNGISTFLILVLRSITQKPRDKENKKNI